MKEKKGNKFSENLGAYICPAVLGALVCYAVIYALYRPMALLYSGIFFLAEFLLFSVFDKLKNRRIFGGVIYIAMMVISFAISIQLVFVGAQIYSLSPITWFYGEEGSYSSAPYFLNAVFIAGGFFVISIIFYFTQIRYRSLGVMLSILFPFVIYAKRADEMPELLVTLIITAFLAVMVHNRRIDPAMPAEKRGRLIANRSYILSMAIFVSVTGAVTMLIDKPTHMSKLEQNANYFNYVQTNATGSGDFEDTDSESSKRYGRDNYTGDPLFYFETDGDNDVYYLRRQPYDSFNGDVWYVGDSIADPTYSFAAVYSSHSPEYSTDDILSDMELLGEKGYFDTVGIDFSDSSILGLHTARVYDDSFSPIYLPSPIAVITDTADFKNLTYYKYIQGTVFRKKGGAKLDDTFSYYEQSKSFYSYAAALGLDGNDYEQALEQAQANGDLDDSEILEDYENAKSWYLSLTGVSDKLSQFAAEITADCESDYEKAKALESYFEDNGYIYDEDYEPEDQSIDYFVFEGKTGVCTSYATAMTLMARAVGLPARYVEGFSAFEQAESGEFVVRDSYAHAFVEVYIPGAGWMTFDPTVSDYMQIPEESNFDAGTFFKVLSRLLVVIIVTFVIIFILLLDRIVEAVFRVRLSFKNPQERVLMLYRNVIKLINFSTGEDYSAYTAKMLSVYLAKEREVELNKLISLFEKTCFGGYFPSADEANAVYYEYKKAYRLLRKLPKKAAVGIVGSH